MEILAPVPTFSSVATRMALTTRQPTEFIDLTDQVATFVGRANVCHGFVNVQSLHTTLAVVVNEHEPLLLSDFVSFLDRLAPSDRAYRHDDSSARTVNLSPGERSNGHAHCRALLLPSSICLNVIDGRLQLGRWQRVFAVELDGPRHREVSLLAMDGRAR